VQPSLIAKKEEVTMHAPSATGRRRFEFSEGNSNKFWEIAVNGVEVNVQFGRIGTQGQSNVKSFPDEAAAARNADKLIQEKTGKGYVEVKA